MASVDKVCKAFRSELDRQRHHAFLPRLVGAGLAPTIIRIDGHERCLKRCVPAREWLETATTAEKKVMREAVLSLVRAVHAAGICHRDLHVDNLVIDDDRPLVIDLELAVAVHPSSPCYDLVGPASGVEVAEQHREREDAYSIYGVWWDSPMNGLGKLFGPLGR